LSFIGVLWAALFHPPFAYVWIIIFSFIELIAIAYFLVSYIPGGKRLLNYLGGKCCVMVRKVVPVPEINVPGFGGGSSSGSGSGSTMAAPSYVLPTVASSVGSGSSSSGSGGASGAAAKAGAFFSGLMTVGAGTRATSEEAAPIAKAGAGDSNPVSIPSRFLGKASNV